jgi:hypothetical protein
LDREWAAAEQADRARVAEAEAARVGVVELERAEVCGKRASPEHRVAEGQAAVAELAAEAVEGQESALERVEEADRARLAVAALEVVV